MLKIDDGSDVKTICVICNCYILEGDYIGMVMLNGRIGIHHEGCR